MSFRIRLVQRDADNVVSAELNVKIGIIAQGAMASEQETVGQPPHSGRW